MKQKIDIEILYETLISSLHEYINNRTPVPQELIQSIRLVSKMGLPQELMAKLDSILAELPTKGIDDDKIYLGDPKKRQ